MFEISTLKMIEGDLPAKAQTLVQEWGQKYQTELMDMWNNRTLKKLPPLE